MTTDINAVHAELAAARQQIQELQQQVFVFTQILDVVPAMVLYKGPQSRIRFANTSFRNYYGMTPDQLQGIIDAPFNEPDYTQQYILDDTHVFTTGQTLEIPQEPVTRFDGEVHQFHTVKNPIYDEQGVIIGTIGVSEDTTAQAQIQSALKESEARAQRLIANIPGMVYQFVLQADGTLRFPYVSNGSREVFGLEPEAIEADAMTLINTIHPVDKAGFEESMIESARTLHPWTWEVRMKRDTAEIWTQGFSRPITQPNGDILWDGVIMDITDRKSAEMMHQRLATILAATPDFVGISTLEGKPLYINPAGRAMVGIDDYSDLNDYHFNMFHPDWAYTIIGTEGMEQAIKTGQWNGETALLSRNNRQIPVAQTILTHQSEDGAEMFLSTICRDLTERKRAEQEQQQLQAQIIKMHATALAELSTPLIVLNDTTVLMPLIGSLDTQRTNQVMETLLNGITTNHALFAIVDLTGVPVVDTQVAMALIRVAQSVQLLGSQVIITGIRPEIAQTLVSLGIDLRGIVTQSDLQMGIRYAMASR